MIKLLLSGFLLSISCILDAATVEQTELTDSPLQLIDKKSTTSAEMPHMGNELKMTVPAPNQPELNRHQLKPFSDTQKAFFLTTSTRSHLQSIAKQQSSPKLADFTEKLKREYGDNELVQQSLSTFYEAKQLWNQADSQANTFAADIIHSLNLNNLIEDNLSSSLPSTQNPIISFFLKKNVNFSRQSQKEKSITFNQVRQTQVNTTSGNINTSTSHFITQLFRMTTVYYLLAFFILFSLLQWAIKFSLRFFP